jgi:hypothetical protein
MDETTSSFNKKTNAIIAAFLAGLVVYLLLFYAAEHSRRQSLLILFIPDDMVLSWVGGDFGRLGVLDRAPVLLVAGSIIALAFVFGRLTISAARCDRRLSRLELFIFSTGVGLSELSLLTLAIGLVGGLDSLWAFVAPIGTVLALAVWQWKRGALWGSDGDVAGADAAGAQDSGWLQRWGLWLGVPFALLILLGGMLPPWDFDVREYHLQVPKEWYLQGEIGFLPHNVYGNMPLGAEMHALLAMVFMPGRLDWWWGALAGKTVIAAFAPLTALALFAAGKRFVSTTAGVVASLVYVSTPWVAHVSVTGLIEGAVGFYLLLAVYAMLLWNSEAGASADPVAARGRILLAGFLAGSAAACKYPAFLFVVLPLALWSLFHGRRFNWKPALLFTMAVVCACGLWLGKNWVLAGNPIYPLVFGGSTRTPEKMEQWNRAHRVPPDDRGRRYSLAQAADAVAQVGWRSAWLSPLLIPLAVMAFVSDTRRRLALILAVYALYFLLTWWLFSHRIDRFLVPLLPVVALLAGIGAAWSQAQRWRTVVVTVLMCGLVASFLLIATGGHDHRYLVALTDLRRDDAMQEDTPPRIRAQRLAHAYLNDAVDDEHRALLVGDAEPFDLEVPVLYNTCFDDCIFEQLMRGRSREERVAALREQGISHVFVFWSDIDRYRSPGNYGFTDYVTKSLVRDELARKQRLLRRVELDIEPESGEVFEVVEQP